MDFKTIETVIKSRRSVYPQHYTDQPIDQETILELLELANWAPNHRKTEPWRFKVYHSLKSRQSLSEFLGKAFLAKNEGKSYPELKYKKTLKKPLQSACVIAICLQRDPLRALPEWEEIAALACAVQNIWLGCTAKGIGSYWSSPSTITNDTTFLDLKQDEKCYGLFYMGYQKEIDFNSSRKPILDKITIL